MPHLCQGQFALLNIIFNVLSGFSDVHETDRTMDNFESCQDWNDTGTDIDNNTNTDLKGPLRYLMMPFLANYNHLDYLL